MMDSHSCRYSCGVGPRADVLATSRPPIGARGLGSVVSLSRRAPPVVNAIREKKQTNMRSSGADEAIQLTPPREMTLEFALEFIEKDELVEVTPKNVRLRKRHLSDNDRRRAKRS